MKTSWKIIIGLELALIVGLSGWLLLGKTKSRAAQASQAVLPATSAYQAAMRKDLLARAEKGDAGDQFTLGCCLEVGMGGPIDQVQSVHWFRKAAAQGVACAICALGDHYTEGAGVTKDLAEAEKLYAEAERITGVATRTNLSYLPDWSQPEIRYRNYHIKVSTTGEDGRKLEIFKDGHRVYQAKSQYFTVGNGIDGLRSANSPFTVGKNITGDGHPNLVIRQKAGGYDGSGSEEGRGYTYLLFDIGEQFRLIQKLGEYDRDRFKDIDGDKALEFHAWDMTFVGWHTDRTYSSGVTEVILKYDGTKYVLAPALMRKAPLSKAELQEAAQWTIEWEDTWIVHNPATEDLCGNMRKLIYSGNMAQAWQLVDLSRQLDAKKKAKFLSDFKAQLRKSPYWPELASMNKASGM